MIDPFGLDSLQRAQAVSKAYDFVNENPGDSYPTSDDFKEGKYRGAPGEKVDCSGMVDNCIVAGEEKSSRNNGKNTGVGNLIAQSEKVGLSVAEVGNFLTLNNSETGTDKSRDLGHAGLIVELERNEKGEIFNLKMIDSGGFARSGKSGPRIVSVIENGKNRYYGSRITGVYKWDTRPDSYNGGMLPEVIVTGTRVNVPKPISFSGF